MHSVEISWFFYHSDFTWNQFLGFLKCKICHFNTFARLWILTFRHFSTFWRLKFIKSTKFRALEIAKTAVFNLLDSQKLISRKIWVMEKKSEISTLWIFFFLLVFSWNHLFHNSFSCIFSHSVKVFFFYHSNFTWNQFLRI